MGNFPNIGGNLLRTHLVITGAIFIHVRLKDYQGEMTVEESLPNYLC